MYHPLSADRESARVAGLLVYSYRRAGSKQVGTVSGSASSETPDPDVECLAGRFH